MVRYLDMRPFTWFFLLLWAVTVINYPNPFNPKGGETVTFECASNSTLESTLYIYDMSARILWQKGFELQGGSVNRIAWNGYSDNNELVGNGIYLYRLVDSANKKLAAKGKLWVINR